MNSYQLVRQSLDQGEGILRLTPTWVPRTFCIPGRRIKLHPDDYYAMGAHRGGIDERWFSSTTKADNGPDTEPNEGLSYIHVQDGAGGSRVLLSEAIELAGQRIIGSRLMDEYGEWPVYSKFFDNLGPLPLHVHQMPKHAALVGQKAKPEAYYFSPQMNNYGARFPHTFFGLEPGTTRNQIKECLANWNVGDNKILDYSKAYRLQLGAGWDVPAGMLHAPGSLCTYEPQYASDVFSMFQSLVDDAAMPRDLLLKSVPLDRSDDLDYMVDMLDWDLNTDPNLAKNRFMAPKPVKALAEMEASGVIDKWVAYRSPHFSAKETTVLPGREAVLQDAACFGVIFVQGHGTIGPLVAETPTLIRYGQMTCDEFFVTESAAKAGVKLVNESQVEPLVMLRLFGPSNPDLSL